MQMGKLKDNMEAKESKAYEMIQFTFHEFPIMYNNKSHYLVTSCKMACL